MFWHDYQNGDKTEFKHDTYEEPIKWRSAEWKKDRLSLAHREKFIKTRTCNFRNYWPECWIYVTNNTACMVPLSDLLQEYLETLAGSR